MRIRVLILTILVLGYAWNAAAQDDVRPADTDVSAKQQLQLLELENKEAALRLRLEELDEALKPENIERALAGIGSTKPEELRAHRRRLLTIEKNGLQTQLKLIEESRTRTESAIAAAESAAYLRYAQPTPTPSLQMAMAPEVRNARNFLRTILMVSGGIIFVFGALISICAKRRLRL